MSVAGDSRSPTRDSSLFDRLGGFAAVQAAVVDFYGRVLEDLEIAHFFHGIDMDRLIAKQVSFMAVAFGAPHSHSGRDLSEAHAPLVARGLNDRHFDRVATHLGETLMSLQIPAREVEEVLAIVESTREAVLGRGTT